MERRRPLVALCALWLAVGPGVAGDVAPALSSADNRLRDACWRGDVPAARRALDEGARIDAVDAEHGNTPLHLAVINRKPAVIPLLAQRRASLNLRTKRGYPAPVLAVFNDDPATVRALLAAGADPGTADTEVGNFALLYAAWEGRDGCVRALLDGGDDVNRRRVSDGQTALLHAAIRERVSTAALLLGRGADPAARETRYGFTALHYAVMKGNVALADVLLHGKAPVDARDNNRLTPLWHVAHGKDGLALARLLLANGADPFVKSVWGSDAWEVAVWRTNSAVAGLIRSNADPARYRHWLTCYPLAGIPQRDFLAWNFVDLEPALAAYPSAIDAAAYARALRNLEASRLPDQVAAMRSYYRPDATGREYRAAGPLAQALREALFIVMIGQFDGRYRELDMLSPRVIRDFRGGTNTYDGHIGMDLFVDDPERQADGCPVFAAADGTVWRTVPRTIVRDGVVIDDSEVWIDHGAQRKTYYMHLKPDLLVKAGDKVLAGSQLGWVRPHTHAYDGHLHFGVMEWGRWVEPHTGIRQTDASRWARQRDYFQGPVAVTSCALLDGTRRRAGFHTSGKTDERLRVRLADAGSGGLLGWRLTGPRAGGGQVRHENAAMVRSWRGIVVAELAPGVWDLAPGPWTLEILYDNVVRHAATITVVAPGGRVANRPPAAPAIRWLEQLKNGEHAVFVCELRESAAAPDPDLDRVRYRYRWFVDGTCIRDVVSLARTDALPLARSAGAVRCEVRAFDGRLSSAAAIAER